MELNYNKYVKILLKDGRKVRYYKNLDVIKING